MYSSVAMIASSDYYSQYQSMYEQAIIFDSDTISNSAECGEEVFEETIYSDFHDTSIQQPSHPYNGDIMPLA